MNPETLTGEAKMKNRFMVREVKQGVWTLSLCTLMGEKPSESITYPTSAQAISEAEQRDSTLSVEVFAIGASGSLTFNSKP
ncbi:hypothetical protein ACXX82_11890 [Glaciimonas sp. GNP009]